MTPMKPGQVPRLLAVDEIAARFGVCGKTIRRWIARGDLRSHRLGRGIRVSEEDLAAFLSIRRH